jgi:para-aminobenzoate synthetase component 1
MSVIIKTIPMDFHAEELLDIFSKEKSLVFLHSSMRDAHKGRFSFLAFNPFKVVSLRGKDSMENLRRDFMPFKTNIRIPQTPLTSGIIGFISYDYGLCQEKIKLQSDDSYKLPDVHFGFYDSVLVIDHFKKTTSVVSTGISEKRTHLKESKSKSDLTYIIKRLTERKTPSGTQNYFKNIKLESNFSKASYLKAIKRALYHIKVGDIYQVNLAQRFMFDLKDGIFNPISFYKTLIKNSPSPFSGYLDAKSFQIMSSSPERFLSLIKDKVTTSPMKGTRPRSRNARQDEKYKKEILLSPKDRAELLMITDLERNDLGRVCRYGSVKVKDMRTIETYKTVYQATSTIEGRLTKDKDGFDLIQAAFPGGSITGCPKIRAMNIIEELEPTRRGIYTGILGYMDFNGDLDFNILIRTALRLKDKLYFQSGGGIVADSKPLKEYNETLVKARGILQTLNEMNKP